MYKAGLCHNCYKVREWVTLTEQLCVGTWQWCGAGSCISGQSSFVPQELQSTGVSDNTWIALCWPWCGAGSCIAQPPACSGCGSQRPWSWHWPTEVTKRYKNSNLLGTYTVLPETQFSKLSLSGDTILKIVSFQRYNFENCLFPYTQFSKLFLSRDTIFKIVSFQRYNFENCLFP